MVTIFLFSATPGDDLPSFGLVDLLVKKGGHMLGYAVLALACLRGFNTWKNTSSAGGRRHSWLWALCLTLAYALTDEAHQMFTPGRHAALTDVGIDMLGAALGQWAGVSIGWLRELLNTGL
jgi:VanZ family protein